MLHVGQESHLQFLSYNGLPYLFQIPLDDVQGIRVTDFQEFLNIREGFYYNAMKELVLTKIQKLSDIVLYWDLPDKFTGNQASNIFQATILNWQGKVTSWNT